MLPSSAHPFQDACARGDKRAVSLAAELRDTIADQLLAAQGLVSALNAGDDALALSLLEGSPVVRSVARTKEALTAVLRRRNTAVLDAVLATGLPLESQAHVILCVQTEDWPPGVATRLVSNNHEGLFKALKMGLANYRKWSGTVASLVRSVPSVLAPRVLDLLVGQAGKIPADVPLPRLMELADGLSRQPGAFAPAPTRAAVSRALSDSRGDISAVDWGRQWARWMVPHPCMADGASWSSLASWAMPAPARAAFWVVLAARMSANGFEKVSAGERALLLRVLTEETLAKPPHLRFSPSSSGALLPSQFAMQDPLNLFLIAWRASACPGLVDIALKNNATAMVQRLVGFGADLNQRLASGYTLLQDIAFNRRSWVPQKGMGNARTDWAVKTEQGESIVHLLFKKALPDDAEEEVRVAEWSYALELLTLFASHLAPSVWTHKDSSGRTPWACMQEFRANLDFQSAHADYEVWQVRNPGLAEAMEAGDLQVVLDEALPTVRVPSPRRRM